MHNLRRVAAENFRLGAKTFGRVCGEWTCADCSRVSGAEGTATDRHHPQRSTAICIRWGLLENTPLSDQQASCLSFRLLLFDCVLDGLMLLSAKSHQAAVLFVHLHLPQLLPTRFYFNRSVSCLFAHWIDAKPSSSSERGGVNTGIQLALVRMTFLVELVAQFVCKKHFDHAVGLEKKIAELCVPPICNRLSLRKRANTFLLLNNTLMSPVVILCECKQCASEPCAVF